MLKRTKNYALELNVAHKLAEQALKIERDHKMNTRVTKKEVLEVLVALLEKDSTLRARVA